MLLCVGSPIVDYIVNIDNCNNDNLLEKYHLEPDGAIKAEDGHQELFQEILNVPNCNIVPAGSVTNTARIFQWMSKKTNAVLYTGAIGKDANGELIKRRLDGENIRYRLVERGDKETGKCAVLISGNGKFRSLVTNPAAAATFGPDDLTEEFWKIIDDECTTLYISAFLLGVSIEVTKKLISHFTRTLKKVVVNLGAEFLCNNYPEEVKYMVKQADIVIGNEKELQALARISHITYKTLNELVEKLYSSFADDENTSRDKILIFTRGPQPVITYSSDGLQYFPVERVENIVDTTACGDAFAGGFLAKIFQHYSLEESVKCGIRCTRAIIETVGCELDTKLQHNP